MRKPGDDEEDVDADVAAGEERQPRVAEQDGDDRDRAQALDVGPKAVVVLCGDEFWHQKRLEAASGRA